MNTKRYFGRLTKFPFDKVLNILVIISIGLASCSSPKDIAPKVKPMGFLGKGLRQKDYEAPVCLYPDPVIGIRPSETVAFAAED